MTSFRDLPWWGNRPGADCRWSRILITIQIVTIVGALIAFACGVR